MNKVVFLLVSYALCSTVSAQSQCPPGMIPGKGGCYSPVGGNSHQRPYEATYENRYGAMAASIGPENKKIGTATSQVSESDAIEIALDKCGKNCEVWFTVVNTCMAAAVGKGDGFYTFRGIGQSIHKAEKRAVAECEDQGLKNCKAEFSSCSLPVRSF